MNKKILISCIITVSILILPTSIAINIDEKRLENIVCINNLKTKPIFSFDRILLIGKISNKTFMPGYTPSYRIHMDLVLTLGNQKPFCKIIQDRDALIICPLFNGFITKFFIIGISQDFFILPI